jgi:hypothetical protein
VLTLIVVIGLVVAGVAAIIFGVFTWRSAKKLVVDARQTLVAMFGNSFPGLFTEEPDPRGARIAAVGFVGVGVALLVAAVVQLL